MELDLQTLLAAGGVLGVGAVLKSVLDSFLNRKRNRTDLASISIEITARVMGEMRIELDDTRRQLLDTRTQLSETNLALERAHDEIAELRAALTNALTELATYQRTTTTTTVSTAPVISPQAGTIPSTLGKR